MSDEDKARAFDELHEYIVGDRKAQDITTSLGRQIVEKIELEKRWADEMHWHFRVETVENVRDLYRRFNEMITTRDRYFDALHQLPKMDTESYVNSIFVDRRDFEKWHAEHRDIIDYARGDLNREPRR